MSSPPASRAWLWAAVLLTVAKLWLVTGQRVFAIGPAFHDDRLFLELAGHILSGQWLGPYSQMTLAKGPMYSVFIAAVFKLGLPLAFAQHLLYAAACATLTRSLRPWLHSGAAWFAFYAVLLWNPMTYEAENVGRVLRQNFYTPLGLFTVAGLITLFVRRRDRAWRHAVVGAGTGLAFGCFWLTREESVWLLPVIGLLFAGLGWSMRRELAGHGRALTAGLACFLAAALLPTLIVSTLNLRHYGWFGTVEFRAGEFKDAYGALTRIKIGPELPQVPVTRQMRLAAYEVSPAFARLRPFLEGPVGEMWSDKQNFAAADREIRGGWFVWALRDAVQVAGVASDARGVMHYYQLVADELNTACAARRVPALPRRSGFLPPLGPELVRPALDEGIKFLDFFFRFRDFTAYSPLSQGDYADLKPFRNFVGSRLSPAPRSPDLPTPEQDHRDNWKVNMLERIGQGLASLFGWVGPLLLLVGAARLVESAVNRRISFALGLAAALLCSCLGYIAINVLIQVTSFPNMTPAALSAAYPLYLAALGAIALDAAQAWRRTAPVSVVAASLPAPAAASRFGWLPAAGTALVVFAARLAEVHFFASDVPYHDQWVVEAQQIIRPWLDGTLGPGAFFTPHFEHLPVWTRLLTWLQVAITGRWDPLVQMTTNAALYAGFTWLVARFTWSVLRPLPAVSVTLLLLLGGALPHAWENIAWGFQSQFPLALSAVVLHVHGCCTAPARSRHWWLAQVAGVAGLFTIASFWLAPFAVILGWLWTGPRRRSDLLAPGLVAAAGGLTLFVIHRIAGNSFTQGTHSLFNFFHSLLHLLGWPSLLPGAVAFVQLPWFVHALRLRGQTGTAPVDRIILATGLFNFFQTAALAFDHVGENNGVVSRYGELMFLGTLASAFALARLTPRGGPGHSRFLALTTLWSVLVVIGLIRNSTEDQARYFHIHAAENATVRRTAVQAFLADGNHALLEAPATRVALSNEPELVARLLAEPRFRALLPASVNPASAPDWAGQCARRLQACWPALLGAGLLALLTGSGMGMWRRIGSDPLTPLPVVFDPWRWRIAAVIGGVALVATLSWSNPLSFEAGARWRRWLGGDDAVTGLSFRFVTPAPFETGRLQGAAPIQPEILRNYFFGTAPEGPEFTGTVVSTPFTITTPWLTVPYAGYPVGHGNGLRLRLLDEQGNQAGDEIGCLGPNVDGIAYWTVDVHAYLGRRVCVVLYDGRTDTEAWVAVSPPIRTTRPELAAELARGLQSESRSAIRIAVALIALVGLACAVLGFRERPAVP